MRILLLQVENLRWEVHPNGIWESQNLNSGLFPEGTILFIELDTWLQVAETAFYAGATKKKVKLYLLSVKKVIFISQLGPDLWMMQLPEQETREKRQRKN